MSSQPPRDRLPFESRHKKKKAAPKPSVSSKTPKTAASLSAIPETVSKRMIRRMAIFSGIPTVLGMSSFFIFYWIVSHNWLEIPTYLVFGISLGLFGLGVLGLSYGIFSTAWEEDRIGGWWGWQEFTTNFGRTVAAWRTNRQDMNKE